jgi:hypothetical protein
MPRSFIWSLRGRWLLAQAFLVFGFSPGLAAGLSGSFAFESLLRPTSALQTALGGLHACTDGGPEALRANPAGMARSLGLVASASHQAWQAGLSEDWVGGVCPVASGCLGAEVSALHAGSLPAYAEDGTSLGSFIPVEMAVGVGYARGISAGLTSGAALHALYMGGGGEELRGISLDLGLEYAHETTRLAVAVRNVGPNPSSGGESYRLPTQVVAGVQRSFGFNAQTNLTAALDRNRGWLVVGGARVSGPGGVSLLCGLAYSRSAAQDELSPRGGLAITMRTVLLAYSYAPAGETGATHHLSVQFSPR